MARRMGKTADDKYMGGGSGNWSRAPKKKTAPKPMKKRNMETANKVKAGLSKSKAMSGGSQGGGRAAANSKVKTPARSSNGLSPAERHAVARSATSGKAFIAARKRRTQPNDSKPQSRDGDGSLGQGRNSPAAQKRKRQQTTVKTKSKTRYERRKTSSAKNSTVGNWFRRNFGTASMRKK